MKVKYISTPINSKSTMIFEQSLGKHQHDVNKACKAISDTVTNEVISIVTNPMPVLSVLLTTIVYK